MSIAREPVQYVEIVMDFCTRSYGAAPCTAALSAVAPRKCFNTYFTCQDQANFDVENKVLVFSQNQNGLLDDRLVYPALQSVSTNPTRINMGGIDGRTGPLGKRAEVRVVLQDFADNDTGTDPYQAGRRDGSAQFDAVGYDPESRGSFFGKLRARWPHYLGRDLRVLEGYAGQARAEMRIRHYVITGWKGPDMSGRVEITAKDVLALAEDEKALCPKPSNGKLAVEIAETGVPVFDLQPAGVGAEYDTSGRASIGSEIVSFTRSGDTITLTGRARDGSEAASHSAGDLFQQCYRVEAQPVDVIAADLLKTFAGVKGWQIEDADWEDERVWTSGQSLTGTIAKPTGVSKLLGELSQLGVQWWWDEVARRIRMRANRPPAPGEAVMDVNDSEHIAEGSLQVADLDKQRLTRVVFWHGMLDASASVTDGSNYARAFVAVNNGGNTLEHGEDRTLEIFCRWFGTGNDLAAGAVATRLVKRYEEIPRQISFTVDAKDREDISVAGLARILTRAQQDVTGDSRQTDMQIVSVEEHKPGHALNVVAETYEFTARYAFLMDTATMPANYASASAEQRARGFFMTDAASPEMSDGTDPYVMF